MNLPLAGINYSSFHPSLHLPDLSDLMDIHSWQVLQEESVVCEVTCATPYWFLMLLHLYWRRVNDKGKRVWLAPKWLDRSRNYISHIVRTVESRMWNTMVRKLHKAMKCKEKQRSKNKTDLEAEIKYTSNYWFHFTDESYQIHMI